MSIYLGNTEIGNGNYLGNLNIRDSNIFMSQSVAPTWTPADFAGLKYYFTAGAGITLSGDYVTTWTDQVSSVALTATTANNSYRPLYSASVSIANNKPALYFTNTGAPYQRLQNQINGTGIASTDDLTVIGIIIPTTNANTNFQVYGGFGVSSVTNYETAMEVGNPTVSNEFAVYVLPGTGAQTIQSGVAINSGVPNWHAVTYKSSNGEVKQYVNSTTAATTTTKATNPNKSNLKIIAGDYSDGGNGGGIPLINGWIMELIYLTAVPTPTELTNLDNYVSTYY
jgi:hypothetical protein